MKEVMDDIIAFCRMFALFEREEVCCGTVTPSQCVLLQTLLSGRWDVSSLAVHNQVTKGAMTRLVDGLEKRGWVRRTQSEEDGRRFIVSLTANGKREASRLRSLTEQSVGAILDRIPEDDREQVMASLHTLRKAAEEARSEVLCC